MAIANKTKFILNLSSKILVTGGTGFLGAYIIKELVQQGYHVRAIRRQNRFPFFIPAEIVNAVEWVDGDILDIVSLDEAMQGIDAVIHAAGKVSFRSADRSEMFKINIEGTANLVNTAIENNIQKFVHISSISAIGRTKNGDTVDEKKKWESSRFHTHYAISKHYAELEVWRGMGEGLNVSIANPSTVLGYGDWNTSSCAIFKNAYKEFPWYTRGTNGFVDVEDVAKAVVALLQLEKGGERYILNGENWPFRKLFDTIAKGFSKKLPSKEATPFLGEMAWRLEKIRSYFSGKPPLLTKETAKIAHTVTYFDNSKILAALPGFRFTPLTETIERACRLYQQHRQPL